jgi:hypothetical protein
MEGISQMEQQNPYWALKPRSEIAAEIESQFEAYQRHLQSTGYFKRIKKSYDTYYGIDKDGSLELSQSDDGAVTKISVNHFKNLLKRLHILITQNKLTFVPRSRNTDAKSQIETDLGKGILEYYADEKMMNGKFSEAVETALVCYEAFFWYPWDGMAGEELMPDMQTGKVLNTGDQAFEVFTALDVARAMGTRKTPWHILRVKMNKYDLAAQYPEFAVEILGSSSNDKYNIINVREENQSIYDDLTDVFILYHGKTPSLPKGRETWVVGSKAIKDSALNYRKVPVSRLSAGDVIEQIYGDSPAFELLPIQQMIDALFSAVCTNNLNHAQQNVFSRDPNIKITKLSEGQNLIHGSEPPTALQLTASSPETYKLIESLVNQEQLLSGVNASARGTPEASLKSGNSLALMLAQAIQYVMVLQQSFAQLASDVGSGVINNIQKFATGEMIAVIGGVSKKSYVKTFKREDILNIDRVSVDLGNPISASVAGRYELMQQMLQFGVLKTPDQIVNFLRTGQTDSSTEDKFKDSILIREENEMLKRGEKPTAMITDVHPQHIMEHREVFSDPEMRKDPVLMSITIEHLKEHGMLWQDLFALYPEMAAAMGIPPPPQMMQPPMGPDGAPAQAGGPAPEGMPAPEVEGVPLPNVPPNAPQESVQAYAQQQDAMRAQSPAVQ